MLLRCLLGLVCVSLLACSAKEGDGSPPSVERKPADQAAEIATETVCEYAERCGMISITCADCSAGPGCPGCYAEHYDVAYGECTAQLGEDFATGFACEPITAEEAARVDECLQVLFDGACPTVEEAEAWANGGPGENPTRPEVCDTLEDIRYRCFEYGDSDGNVPEPQPGG
jgi:hypothetical protein